ncbi:tetratricopeptide repeat protein [Undibacterium sp. Di26W]|uniref:tetratricopeptide repeat protein n=1 Tax=Undibacterium sp. Di26W TaxID=3413035 RepID=UPI003BF23E68
MITNENKVRDYMDSPKTMQLPATIRAERNWSSPQYRQTRYGTDTGAGAKATEPYSSTLALGQIQQGHDLCMSGKYIDAEAYFRAAAELEPNWPMPHNNLGWVLQAQGKNEAALTSYKRAVELNPAFELAQTNLAFLLANLYFSIGKFAEARSMWLVLASHNPQDHHVLDNLICTALRVHDLHEAAYWANCHAAVTRASAYHQMLPGIAVAPPDLPIPVPKVSRGKLLHDRDQYQYLYDKGLVGAEFGDIIKSYVAALDDSNLQDNPSLDVLPVAHNLRNTYGRINHHYPAGRLFGNALSFSESMRKAEDEYRNSQLGVVVIDDFLTPEALSELQRFCLESTIWHSNHYAYDRLGAFFREGFNCPLLLQIAEELQLVFPDIIGLRHALLQMWGFKYRHDQPSTHPHADFAAVNVNFWITPDEANQDRQSGGLVIYDIEAPLDWPFDAYNRQGDKIAAFLEAADAKRIVIPYRCNRAIIFNSDLFHATAALSFLPGYVNQRINVTMLYGDRAAAKTT